MYMY